MERCDEGAVNLSSGRETTERSSMKDEDVKGHSPFVKRLRTKARLTESSVPFPPPPTPPPLAKVQLNARSSPTVPSSSIPAASSL